MTRFRPFRFRLRTMLLLVTITCAMLALRHPPPVVVQQTQAEAVAEWSQLINAAPEAEAMDLIVSAPRDRRGVRVVNGEEFPTALVRALESRPTNLGRRSIKIELPGSRVSIIGWRAIIMDVKMAKGHKVVTLKSYPQFSDGRLSTTVYVEETYHWRPGALFRGLVLKKCKTCLTGCWMWD